MRLCVICLTTGEKVAFPLCSGYNEDKGGCQHDRKGRGRSAPDLPPH